MEWQHVGDASATSHSSVLCLGVRELHEVMNSRFMNTALFEMTMEYCQLYYFRTISAQGPEWPTDIEVPLTSFIDVVISLCPETQILIGLMSIDSYCSKNGLRFLKAARMRQLKTEVRDGLSTVLLNKDGELERVACVTALHIEDRGYVLTQIASQEGRPLRWGPKFRVPGIKQERGESPEEAGERALQAKLAPLVPYIQLTHSNREVLTEESERFAVGTKYLRTAMVYRLSKGDDFFPDRPSQLLDREAYIYKNSIFTWITYEEGCTYSGSCSQNASSLVVAEGSEVFCLPPFTKGLGSLPLK
eukprot:715900-Amphidinium_carterae.1